MAEDAHEAENPETVAPGEREGRAVSILTDRSLIVEAFRRGWIKSVEQAERILGEAIFDVEAARQSMHDPVEMAKLSNALARTAWGAVGVRTKAIQAAEGQTAGVTNNTQVVIGAASNQDLVAELKKQIPLNDRVALLEKLEADNGNGNGHSKP